MMRSNYGHMGWMGAGLGWIFMVIFWAVLIGAIFALVRGAFWRERNCCNNEPKKFETGRNEAMDVLKKRYAKGEISKEDWEKMKKDLE